MPKFLETKLKKEYGENSAIPFKVMNAMGAMHGNKETAKGRQMEEKHEAKMKAPSVHTPTEKAPHEKMAATKAPKMRRMEIEIHRGPKDKVTGFTVHHNMMPKATKSAAFMENTTHSHPFGTDQHEQMMDHIHEHTAAQLGKQAGGAEGEEEEEV